jgi:ubiquinone/menaquinone biosynthesis C-methylase UbiE
MEERKIKEIEYYDREAKECSEKEIKESGSKGGFNPFDLASYKFLRKSCEDKIKGRKVLDYGCGTGTNLIWLASGANKVIGIDLSKESLKRAEKLIEEKKLEKKTNLVLMDCEKMEFSENSFDIIFDGATFSSLELNKALPEIHRVLKKDGFLIGIETLGHNPLTNLKRTFNRLTGRRTEWAAEHIFRMEDLKLVKEYFDEIEMHFFHLISWISFPFLNLPGGKFMLKLLEKIDSFIISIFPFLKKYSFKIVFIFSSPIK